MNSPDITFKNTNSGWSKIERFLLSQIEENKRKKLVLELDYVEKFKKDFAQEMENSSINFINLIKLFLPNS